MHPDKMTHKFTGTPKITANQGNPYLNPTFPSPAANDVFGRGRYSVLRHRLHTHLRAEQSLGRDNTEALPRPADSQRLRCHRNRTDLRPGDAAHVQSRIEESPSWSDVDGDVIFFLNFHILYTTVF